MNEQLQGAAITAIFGFIAWLGSRFFKKHDENNATLTLLVNNTREMKESVARLHVRMSEFFAMQKEISEEVHEIDKRVAIIEKTASQ